MINKTREWKSKYELILIEIHSHIRKLVLLLTISATSVVLEIIHPLVWGKVLVTLFDMDIQVFWKSIVVLTVVVLLSKAITALESYYGNVYELALISSLKKKIYSSLFMFDISDLNLYTESEVLNRTETDVGVICKVMKSCFQIVAVNLSKMILLCFAILSMNLWLALMIVFGTILIALVSQYSSEVFKKKDAGIKLIYDTYNSLTYQIVKGFAEIKVLGISKPLLANHSCNIDKVQSQVLDFERFNHFVVMLIDMLSFALDILVMIFGSILILNGKLDYEYFIALVMYSKQFYYSFKNIIQLNISFQGFKNSYKRVIEMSEKWDCRNANNQTKDLEYGPIKFFNHTYEYKSGGFALVDIDISIDKTSKIGIAGHNGSGKSTLIKNLLRYSNNGTNGIYINNVPVSEFSIDSYYRRFSVVTQDSFLLNVSIRDNITLFSHEIDVELLDEVCELMGIRELIHSLESGYDEMVRHNGREFSRGQQQRLLLARSLLKEADIFIFDEATSQIDTESVPKIIDNILIWNEEKTSIFITHDTQVLKRLSNVFYLREGKCVCSGNHLDLLRTSNEYRSVFDLS